jgi:hypothetical protein
VHVAWIDTSKDAMLVSHFLLPFSTMLSFAECDSLLEALCTGSYQHSTLRARIVHHTHMQHPCMESLNKFCTAAARRHVENYMYAHPTSIYYCRHIPISSGLAKENYNHRSRRRRARLPCINKCIGPYAWSKPPSLHIAQF